MKIVITILLLLAILAASAFTTIFLYEWMPRVETLIESCVSCER